MHIIDFYPLKGFFHPGETIRLAAEIEAAAPEQAYLQLDCFNLERQVGFQQTPIALVPGVQSVPIEWQPPSPLPRAYGLKLSLSNDRGKLQSQAFSAADVLGRWSDFLRYGFLSDFSSERMDIEKTLDGLVRFHLTGLQFYDWQYRHDELLPPVETYLDPLGRPLSLETIRRLLAAAHERGMVGLAYLAVYAASLEFWRQRPEWSLYDADGAPLTFFDFLGLMDPSPDKPWAVHLSAECGRLLQALPFDGLHVDQYGDPKVAYDSAGSPVDLPGAFAAFMDRLRRAHPRTSLLFNAVGNWPIEAVAAAPTDAVYIEIWPPATRYTQVAEIVRNARRLSAGKPVIIALYLPADRPANNLLADAVILAAGGTRIEIGEAARLLADPYFPKHQAIPPDLYRALRRYASFAVRYAAFLGPQAGEADDITLELPPEVLAIPRRNGQWLSIPLVNLGGLGEPAWDQPHPAPQPVRDLQIRVVGARNLRAVWWASPDLNDPTLLPADWQEEGAVLTITTPRLEIFTLIAIDLGSDEKG
jgi:dextranase